MKRKPYVTKRERKALARKAKALTPDQIAHLRMMALASTITTEVQLQRRLLMVEPTMRASVEKLIRPYTRIAHG